MYSISEIEVNVALSCSCFLAIPSFWKRHFPHGLKSVRRFFPSIFSTQITPRPTTSDGKSEPKVANNGKAPKHAPYISNMASITPGRENYVQLHDMANPAIPRGDMVDGRTRNDVVIETGSLDSDIEKLTSRGGIVKITNTEQYTTQNNS